MSSVQSEDGDFGFQIAPMVDIVFVLMLFFMAAAAMQTVDKGLTSVMGSKEGGSFTPTIVIDITSQGQVITNGTPMDLPELRAWFTGLQRDFGQIDPVILRPSPETVHADIVKVLDAMASSGVTQVSFN